MSDNRPVLTLSSRRRLIRAGSLVAIGATAVALVSGCAPRTSAPGVAALIGGAEISDVQLQNLVNADYSDSAFATAKPDRATETRTDLTTLILLRLLNAGAKKVGVSVTPAEVAQTLATAVQQSGGKSALDSQLVQSGEAPAETTNLITESLLVSKLTSAETSGKLSSSQLQSAESQVFFGVVSAELKLNPVHVSPRYGTFTLSQSTGPAITATAQKFNAAATG